MLLIIIAVQLTEKSIGLQFSVSRQDNLVDSLINSLIGFSTINYYETNCGEFHSNRIHKFNFLTIFIYKY